MSNQVVAAATPTTVVKIKIVLRRVTDPTTGMQSLVQDPLTPAQKAQIEARYNDILNGPPGIKIPFFAAYFHASQQHPGETHPLIVLSHQKGDEMTWQVMDQTDNPETGFTVSVAAKDTGPDDPFVGFPKNDGGFKIVHSGPPKATHADRHFKFKVEAAGGVTFDPDWYSIA